MIPVQTMDPAMLVQSLPRVSSLPVVQQTQPMHLPLNVINNEKEIRKQWSNENKLFVRNLPPDCNEQEVKGLFSYFGEVADDFKIHPKQNLGFVRYRFKFQAEKAIFELNGRVFQNHLLEVNFAKNTAMVKVSHLFEWVTDEMLQQSFQKFGPVEDAYVMIDPKTKKSKNYGFVHFVKTSDAIQCVKQCRTNMFILSLSPRPVKVCQLEPDLKHQSNKSLPREHLKDILKREEDAPPHFASPNTFEYELCRRWLDINDKHENELKKLKLQHQKETDQLENDSEMYSKMAFKEKIRSNKLEKEKRDALEKQVQQQQQQHQHNMLQFIAPQQNFLNPQYGVNAFINGNNTFALNPQSAQQFHAFNLGSPVHQNLNQIAQVPQAQIPQKQILFPQNVQQRLQMNPNPYAQQLGQLHPVNVNNINNFNVVQPSTTLAHTQFQQIQPPGLQPQLLQQQREQQQIQLQQQQQIQIQQQQQIQIQQQQQQQILAAQAQQLAAAQQNQVTQQHQEKSKQEQPTPQPTPQQPQQNLLQQNTKPTVKQKESKKTHVVPPASQPPQTRPRGVKRPREGD